VFKLSSDFQGLPQPHFLYNEMSENNFDISILLHLLPSKETDRWQALVKAVINVRVP